MYNRYPSKIRQRRERFFNIPAVVIAIIILCFFAYVIPAYFMSYEKEDAFFASFGFVPVLFAIDHGLMTRLSAITYSFLHGSWTHLGLNMTWFIIFGSPLASRLGSFFFLLFWIFMAFIAALTHFVFYTDSTVALVGASGAISGLMGAAARYDFQHVPEKYPSNRSGFSGSVLPMRVALQSRTVLVFVGGWFFLNLLTGIMSYPAGEEEGNAIAWEAHIGGLLAGFLTIGFFDRRSSLPL